MMKILVLSNASFLKPGIRTGLQQLAWEWAAIGHGVDYVSCPVHALDFASPTRRRAWRSGWLGRGETPISSRLVEHVAKVPFGRHKRGWFGAWQRPLYTSWLPIRISGQTYDACVYDASYAALFVERIQAKKKIFRLNDNPEGFEHHMSPHVIGWMRAQLEEGRVDAVWAASAELAQWALALDYERRLPISILPNGLDLRAYAGQEAGAARMPRSVVYVGGFNPWFDWELLAETARRMALWTFDLYGPMPSPWPRSLPGNVHIRGSVAFSDVPALLRRYRVGILPFRHSGSFLEHFDPLKALQYWAAGLGVAATSLGRMPQALGAWASFGTNAEEFAAAIEVAASAGSKYGDDGRLGVHLQARDWKTLAADSLTRLEALPERPRRDHP
jgi:glycosyltransferase involved in cell wall biosynthesis